MKIEFKAQEVSYIEALGGDIVQVSFAEKDSDDLLINPYKYVHVSVNYEFPPPIPQVEWCDGTDFNGGARILDYVFSKDSLELNLEGNVRFNISFETDEATIGSIERFLLKTCT